MIGAAVSVMFAALKIRQAIARQGVVGP